jgi:MFS transporter, ACS family, allantoate permease
MAKDEIGVAQDAVSSNLDSPTELTAETAVKAVKAGRAKDVDIAARFIADHGHELHGNQYSEDEERKVIRKVDWRLVPIVSLPQHLRWYTAQLTIPKALRLRDAVRARQDSNFSRSHLQPAGGPEPDRSAVLLVRISTILRGPPVHWACVILFAKVSIRLSTQVSSLMIRHRFPVVNFFALNVLCWGIAEICMAACTNFATLFVCRFFLGGFEALVIPATTLLVAMWYRPEEQPKRNAIILNVM